jgi:response regulator RpfG family c-di-GMP phosphodiesterase
VPVIGIFSYSQDRFRQLEKEFIQHECQIHRLQNIGTIAENVKQFHLDGVIIDIMQPVKEHIELINDIKLESGQALFALTIHNGWIALKGELAKLGVDIFVNVPITSDQIKLIQKKLSSSFAPIQQIVSNKVPSSEQPKSGKPRVLIVESSMRYLEHYRYLFAQWPEVELVSFHNPLDAFESFLEDTATMALATPWVILYEWDARELPAAEFVKKLKDNPLTASIAYIFTATRKQGALWDKATELGAGDLIIKPAKPWDFERVMIKYL